MPELRDVVAYLCKNYPHKHELSKARLTKLVYLADWKSVLDQQHQLTKINWIFNQYGPYVDDVYDAAIRDPDFNVQSTTNMYGNPKHTISLKHDIDIRSLTKTDVDILNHVIEQTRRLNWNEFIQLVYSTYPILTGTRGHPMDLVAAADTYKIIEEFF